MEYSSVRKPIGRRMCFFIFPCSTVVSFDVAGLMGQHASFPFLLSLDRIALLSAAINQSRVEITICTSK